MVADGDLPDPRNPPESVQGVAGVEVHRGGVHHFLAASRGSKVAHRLDGAHAHSAIEATLETIAPRSQEIAGPAVKTNAVDEIAWALGRFQVMFTARVIGIADPSIAIAVIDCVLAPDLSLAHMD